MGTQLKTVYQEVVKNNIVDFDTGEVVDEKVEVKKLERLVGKDEFYLMYASLVNYLYNNCTDLKVRVYAFLLERYNSKDEFQFGNPMKKIVAERLGCSIGSIGNAITQLKRDNVIYSPSRGLYLLNPKFAFRGSSKSRDQHLTAIVKLGCKDCV